MLSGIPVVKERLNISPKCLDIQLFRSLIIFVGILFRPVDLQLLKKERILCISRPVVGAIMNDSKLLSSRKYSTDLLENFIFA